MYVRRDKAKYTEVCKGRGVDDGRTDGRTGGGVERKEEERREGFCEGRKREEKKRGGRKRGVVDAVVRVGCGIWEERESGRGVDTTTIGGGGQRYLTLDAVDTMERNAKYTDLVYKYKWEGRRVF